MVEMERLKEIVGTSNVLEDRSILETFSKDTSFVHEVNPRCVVRPQSVQEVQNIVQFANDTLIPLVPVSSGPPHFNGDTVPGVGGAVVVDLSGMRNVLRVDRENRVAMCEPGVTFGELIPVIEKEGLRLNLPFLPRATKSIAGSLLSREPVTMPGYHWDIADPLDCLEVVFGTGDLFRTGGAAGPGTIEDQLASGGAQDEPLGPGQADWHRAIQGAQGTMGIVTWVTMRCELLPKIEDPFVVGSSRFDKIMELVHWLVRLRLVNECFVINSTVMATIMSKPDSFQTLKDSLAPWILFFNIAGYEYFPEERVGYQCKDMLAVAQRIGLEPVRQLNGIVAREVLDTIRKPSEEPYWKICRKGSCQDIFFIAQYDKLAELIGTMSQTADQIGYPATNIGVYIQPIVQGSSYHCEFQLFYDPLDKTESKIVMNLSTHAVEILMNQGAFFSRPFGKSAFQIINRDAATVSAMKKIKKIVDPNQILNPGKLYF